MAGKWRLTIDEGFCASHQLRNYNGKCEHLHGHNFGVSVEVEGSELDPAVEILVDFGELKRLAREAVDALDHAHLNDLPAFAERNPSSENIARHLYQGIREKLAALAPQARLVSVSVSEKGTSRATYLED
ncbi:6-pyruvoyltetrahydropterin/6-carboxytetrahydropterin synthase [Humidesulfovibrio mexicanus]|uniref:6-carboxy-5,6,7,8-tetrahydropterin synthase n=1 Tax=Humidesulfovibrio mexicanus TaxID=147047 RepID=A0A238ZZH6_9BACT|nr:6-carboxytetrahydropterin synthase QueD [Humidesulfovibrio mexicanus]SNR88174.1 6-pyruvoyltetrahydropterin/6-carboxytetrahydropterin synthase [Humidesulfovibrio mexicanus]